MSGATLARSAARAYARADVVSVCRASGDRRRSTSRFCAGACSRAAWRVVIPIAHQRRIRERCPRDMENIDCAKVEHTPRRRRSSSATSGSVRYRPRRRPARAQDAERRACGRRGLHSLARTRKRRPVRAEHRNLAVCLTRGACVHWAHPHAASFLISRACSRQKSSSAGRFSTAMPTQLAGHLFRIDPLGSPRVGASAVVMRLR